MPEFLRDPAGLVAGADETQLRRELDQVGQDRRAELRLCGKIGEIERVSGRDGRPMLRRALELARALGDIDAVQINTIRYATACFYMGDAAGAEQLLTDLISDLERAAEAAHLHFAYQHLGKCLAEQGRYKEAVDLFEKALARRTDPVLRASSERAIAEADRLRRG